MKHIIIDTHGNIHLDALVLKALKDVAGIALAYPDRNPERFPFLSVSESGCVKGDKLYRQSEVVIDAATEMGKLIELLEQPTEVVIKSVAQDAGRTLRDGVIDAKGSNITIGCSTVTFEKVEEVYLAMKKLREKK